jgi:hypothetical protein
MNVRSENSFKVNLLSGSCKTKSRGDLHDERRAHVLNFESRLRNSLKCLLPSSLAGCSEYEKMGGDFANT